MPQRLSRAGERAWKNYQEIERVVMTRYKLDDRKNLHKYSQLTQALQYLGKAVIMRYDLKDKELRMDRWIVKLHQAHVKSLRLSNIEEMLSANLYVWQGAIEAIPDQSIGYDSYVDGVRGRAAGYWPQPSLKEALDKDFYEIKKIVDMTPGEAFGIFERIQNAVNREMQRVSGTLSNEAKCEEMAAAVHRLGRALILKYKECPQSLSSLPDFKLDVKQIEKMDLYSVNSMLDANIRDPESSAGDFACFQRNKSLRQVLNYSRINLFRPIFGLQPALWGKTLSLENVEKELYSHPE